MKYTLWPQVVKSLSSQLSAQDIEHWFANDKIIEVEQQGQNLQISVYSHLQAEWMDSNYSEAINYAVRRLTGEDLKITYIIHDSKEQSAPYEYKSTENNISAHNQASMEKTDRNNGYFDAPQGNTVDKAFTAFRYNPRYTFESFVVGSSNRFAYAAALAVADRPAQSYNPLFLHGGSGLGKTHLMHAIGHHVKELRPYTNVVYISTEAFTNDFISSVRRGDAHKFKNRYRNCDIFLVDDIQFLTGKEGTQEEFFHTFNALHENGKQIVISSDRHPKDIATLEERLRSRFEGGLITDIQPPDLETRIAILQYKASQENIKILDETLFYIANNIPSNIRELEGALNRVAYYANFNNVTFIPLSLAKEALRGVLPEKQKEPITIEQIKQTVCNYFKIRIADLSSSRRDKAITTPRHIAMYLCREILGEPLLRIGAEFGGRDHSTVLHGCDKVQQEIDKNGPMSQTIKLLYEQITK